MHVQELSHDNAAKTIVIVFDTDEEVAAGLLTVAREHRLSAARFTGIGALSSAMLGWYNCETKVYEHIPVREQTEVLSLVGNVSMENDEPKVHAHLVVGKRTGQAFGGHLLQAYVRPTMEVMLVETPAHLRRVFNRAAGLPMLQLE